MLGRVALLLRPYLDRHSRVTLSRLNSSWQHWELYGDCPLVHPQPPLRRRRRGFGRTNPKLSVSHSDPSGYFIIHLAWDFLLPQDRAKLAVASPSFEAYARLRRSAVTVDIARLRLPRQPVGIEKGLTHDRAWRAGVALLRFDFNYGDLIRWLGGEYTNESRDWDHFSDVANAVRDVEPPPGYPNVDFDRAFRACTEGVPLAGDYSCSFESVRQRNLYDNHPGLADVKDEVRARFAKEEAQSFHIAFPRFLWRFIVGIHLAALVWAIRKLKGRLCVDPSTPISPTDDGAANASIPAPGTLGREDECPPIYYASALMRHLTWIWRLRIQFPRKDIKQYVDDIHAAFHRVLYHPDAAILFASVFEEFLIVPIGTIFGARNSPSFFCLLSELRSHIASNTLYRRAWELNDTGPSRSPRATPDSQGAGASSPGRCRHFSFRRSGGPSDSLPQLDVRG